MNTAIIEKVLDLVCEELNKKWIGYDTNCIYRDSFLNDILSYDYLISDKWLQYLFTYINIETEIEIQLIDEYYPENLNDFISSDVLDEYNDEDLYTIEITENKPLQSYRIMVYEKIDTIKQISCNYDYLCNIID